MTVNMLYFMATVASFCGLVAVWEFGLQSFFLDAYRSRLFEIRNYLFNLGDSGKVSFDDPAYRSTELLLNGLIQYAHRMSFLSLVMSRVRGDRDANHEYIKFRLHMNSLVERAPAGARSELRKLQVSVSNAVSSYMAASSLLFKIAFAALAVVAIFRPGSARSRTEGTVSAIEHRAYLAAKKHFNISSLQATRSDSWLASI